MIHIALCRKRGLANTEDWDYTKPSRRLTQRHKPRFCGAHGAPDTWGCHRCRWLLANPARWCFRSSSRGWRGCWNWTGWEWGGCSRIRETFQLNLHLSTLCSLRLTLYPKNVAVEWRPTLVCLIPHTYAFAPHNLLFEGTTHDINKWLDIISLYLIYHYISYAHAISPSFILSIPKVGHRLDLWFRAFPKNIKGACAHHQVIVLKTVRQCVAFPLCCCG